MSFGKTYRVIKPKACLLGPTLNNKARLLNVGELIVGRGRVTRYDMQMDLFQTPDGFEGVFSPHDGFGFADMRHLEEVR